MPSVTTSAPNPSTDTIDPELLTGTRFVLIRHGESRAQAEGFISGHDTCTGLSDLGRRQAERLAERLARTGELDGSAVFATSLLPRAQETGGLIASAIDGGVEFDPHCEWCEMHPGSVEGMTWSEAVEKVGFERIPDPTVRRAEGMETWSEVFTRVGARMRQTAAAYPGQTIVVAGHGGTVGASFVELGGFDAHIGRQRLLPVINTSMTEWRHDGSGWILERFNDAAHLLGVDL